jgi:hypothetical protein
VRRTCDVELCFTSESYVAVREAFGNACPDKEVSNKATLLVLLRQLHQGERNMCTRGRNRNYMQNFGLKICS